MEIALYYTLSTIAQALAAGFAVLAAFVLYRLQGMESEILRSREVLSRYREYITPKELWRMVLEKNFDEIDSHMRKIEQERCVHFYSPSTLREPAEQLMLWWPLWKKTTFWLRVSLVVTVIDIGVCFALLPFVPDLALTPAFAWSSLSLAVVLGLLAIYLYARLIWILLSPARLGPPE